MASLDQDTDQQPAVDTPERSTQNILEKLVSLFLRMSDPEKEKKRLLKQIVRDLKKFKIRFYKPRGSQVQPALAKYFYDIYKVIGPAQTLVQHADTSGLLKTIIIESVLPEEMLSLRDQLSEESIRKRFQETDAKTLAGQIKEQLVTYFAAFDSQKVREIDAVYALLAVFLDIVHFDYFFLLKKFDSSLGERDFSTTPKFEIINGEYVIDDLKEFLEILYTVDRSADWERLLDLLKEYRGVDVVSRQAWKKAIQTMKDIQRSGIFELMVKHLTEDPYFKVTVRPPRERIVEPYLNKLKTQTEVILQKIYQERRTAKVDGLLMQVFGTTSILRLKNYTDKFNSVFAKKMLGGFTLTAPLNYLKAFLLDYFKKDVREIADLLLIRGQWSTNILSQQLSESFHQLMQISEELIKFDDSLSEEGEIGMKLKKLLSRSDKDQNNMKVLRQTVKDINDKAQWMLNESAQNLIAIGKNIKQVIEDHRLTPPEIIINWKELELACDCPIDDKMSATYRKIYYFMQLLQMFVKSE